MTDQLLSRRVEKLEELFNTINAHLFGGKLQPVVITISPDTTRGAYGWFTVGKRWSTGMDKDAKRYHEINICAEWCNRPIKEIVATLIHEMVHLFCSQNSIKDTSNRGNYHNTRFADAAKAHGLRVEKSRYGWNRTSLSEETSAWVESLKLENFDLFRVSAKNETNTEGEGKREYTKWIKMVCPVCGEVIKVKKVGKYYCGNEHDPVAMLPAV